MKKNLTTVILSIACILLFVFGIYQKNRADKFEDQLKEITHMNEIRAKEVERISKEMLQKVEKERQKSIENKKE